MQTLQGVRFNNNKLINRLSHFYDKALIRKLYERHVMSGRQVRGGSTYQVGLRKLTYYTVSGQLTRKRKRVNNLNQTITFVSRLGTNGIIFMCPIQFSAGVSG